MFCNSLRTRPTWSPLVPTLLASQLPRWTEKSLHTHDIAIPLPQRGGGGDQGTTTRILMLLLSASDMKSDDANGSGMARIERLYHLNGGYQVAIVFLIDNEKEKKGEMEGNGVGAYMELQASLLSSSFEIPIIPLSSPLGLQATLFAYQRQLLQPRDIPAVMNPTTAVLPYCTDGTPMPEHSLNVLSDIFRNFKELAMAATTEDGKDHIRKWLGASSPQNAEGVIAFWLQEYVAE